jgi:hypothetical protein
MTAQRKNQGKTEIAPRLIVPMISEHGSAFSFAAAGASLPHLTYHGGPLLTSAQVVTIFWGAAWNQAAQAALIPQINQFFDFILTSSLMDVLTEYSVSGQQIGHGSRTGSVKITTTEPGGGTGTVSDAQIQQALQGWISAGTVPPRTSNTLYFVYLPPGVVSTMGGGASCQQYCGYHNQIGGATFYAVEPYITCAGCSFGQIFNSLTKVSSHELCEAITDPALNAWFDPNTGDEIGDICNGGITQLGGYTVQTEWSNLANMCVLRPEFSPVYAQGDPGTGIGGYDLKSPRDQVFAFDYDSTGKLDHLALYRPGTGTIWILKNTAGAFAPVYQQGDPGTGIGGYDLKSAADQAFAFDYDHSGKLDHLALYRPGTGTIWILKSTAGTFAPVYQQGDPGTGIGGYDLKSPADRAFAFDYDSSGKLDYLALYRPGTGTIWILKNTAGTFAPVYQQGDPGTGIGGYDLKSPADRAFAFDYDSSGKLDYLALYRPGTGTIWILKNTAGTFAPVYQQGDPGTGIGGYDLKSPADRSFAFDFDSSGKLDHLALYRPGAGTIWILRNSGGQFTPVYNQGDPGLGIGGYDLKSPADLAFPFDYDSSSKLDHITLYRPAAGTIWILRH